MKKKRPRGRPQIGRKQSFTIGDSEYKLLKTFAHDVLHKSVSEVIRGLIKRENQDLLKWARELAQEKKKR